MSAVRAERLNATREQIMTAAERLFAEQGVSAVSNRQISLAAGQGNNAAVGYHFGTKADLVRAIVRKRTDDVELLRRRMLAEIEGSADVRDWVGCLVRSLTEYLAGLGAPTWYARFAAQVMTDPALRQIMSEEALTSPTLQRVVDGLRRCLPRLTPEVRAERADMASRLIVHMCAERERALAEGRPTVRPSWHDAATGLIDVVTAIWTAPATTAPAGRPHRTEGTPS
ncbi:TetR/AcrR family transcriptional regulator [Streptosporangium sandarakinum]|uniref:TetR/AcrR family transcriptional regulator n=1 Tax=Streptosporangium sandarakinum TaxID=1260955 RepID=UPI003D8B669A